MADFKTQIVRTKLPPDYVDFRGDKFRGSPDDEHRTIPQSEFRVEDPTKIDLLIRAAQEFNKAGAVIADMQPDFFAPIATALGLGGSGKVYLFTRCYDND